MSRPAPKTKKEALNECLQLWTYIAEHYNDVVGSIAATRAKYEAAFHHDMDMYLHCCPCCEYTNEPGNEVPNCTRCPLWENHDDTGSAAYQCEHNNSPYYRWYLGQAEASEMVKLIKEVKRTGKKVFYGEMY